MLNADLVISELLASNVGGHLDFFETDSDFIEIHNRGSSQAILNGWHLTDDLNQRFQWEFPVGTTVAAGQRLVVYASGQDGVTSSGQLHTNFKLSPAGEELALVDPEGTVISGFDPAYPPQATNVSYGLRESNAPLGVFGFMATPTPGGMNSTARVGFTQPPTFSTPGGTFSNSVQVALSGESGDTQIRYTTNLSKPTENSTLYTGPILLNSTKQIRAIAFRSGYVPSEIVTESYVKLAGDLVNYENSGLPFSSQVPVVVLETFGQSISADNYQNIYFSLFEPQGGQASLTDAVALDSRAGLKIRGSTSSAFAKKPYALELHRDGDDTGRNLALLGMGAESDWVLVGPFLYDRTLNHNRVAFELGDQIGRTTMDTRFIEVFVNTSGDVSSSDYVGVYVLQEKIKRDPARVDIEKLSSQMITEPDITGGYIIKVDRLDPGDSGFFAGGQMWLYVEPKESEIEGRPQQRNYLTNYLSDFISAVNTANFRHPTTNQHYGELVDIGSMVDFHMINELTLNAQELFSLSAYWHKARDGKLMAGPIWDFDRSLESDDPRDNDPTTWYLDLPEPRTPLFWFRVFDDLEFRQAYIDRWSALREAAFSDANLLSTIDRMVEDLGTVNSTTGEPDSVSRNFYRWPQVRPRTSGGYNSGFLDGSWQGEIAHQKAWLQARAAWLDSLFLKAPTIEPDGGAFIPQTVTMTRPTGATIYYTTDGSDPRLPGGGISLSATEYTGPIQIVGTTTINARSFDADYNVPLSSFNVSASNVEAWSGIRTALFSGDSLAISEVNYHPNAPTAWELAWSPNLSDSDFEFIELQNTGQEVLDLTGVRLVDGVTFDFTDSNVTSLDPDDRVLIVRNQAGFELRYGTGNSGRIAGQYSGGLSNGGEQLMLVNSLDQVIQQFTYGDGDEWTKLADGFGATLELLDPQGDLDNADSWRASSEFQGTPGGAGVGPLDSVVVNEVLTNTDPPIVDAIELYNPTGTPIDIGGWWLSDSLDNLNQFVFPSPTLVAANGYLVLDQNQVGFGLDSVDGEQVVLVQPSGVGSGRLFVDYQEFAAARLGESFGRWPNGIGELYPMVSTTLGTENSGPRIGPVVITEVMFNAQDPEDGSDPQWLEFVELYNPTGQVVDLTDGEINGIQFDFPAGTLIQPGQVLVVVPFDPVHSSPAIASFEKSYEIDLVASGNQFLGPYTGRLANDGERLTLLRSDGPPLGNPPTVVRVIEDQVFYDNEAPWPTAAAGQGSSLQRRGIDRWGNDPDSWESGLPTPGRLARMTPVLPEKSTVEIGEMGTITDLTDQKRTVTLTRAYTQPVVFTQPASFNSADPVIVRVSDVQSNQFEIFLAEPSDRNGLHREQETVSYVVLEAGSHWLSDGTHIEVGTVETDAAVGVNIAAPAFEAIDFRASFTDLPVVFSQTQTMAGEAYLSTRQWPATMSRFLVALEGEEQFGPAHSSETIGYLAIDSGSGTWNEMPFIAASSVFTDDFRSVTFTESNFTGVPKFLASLSSYVGIDNVHLRLHDLDRDCVTLKIEEDTTFDTEIAHSSENVSYLAIDGQNPLLAVARSLGDGQTKRFPADVTNAGIIRDLSVSLDVVHSRVADLKVAVEAPDGTLVELFHDVGGESNRLPATTFDDGAVLPIASATAPISGVFQPSGVLQDFVGREINGTWTLVVTDVIPNGHSGALLDWSMEVELVSELSDELNGVASLHTMQVDDVFTELGSTGATYDLSEIDDAVDDPVDNRQRVDNLGQMAGMPAGLRGDTDGDGDVDTQDITQGILNFTGFGGAGKTWRTGDTDDDGDVDTGDVTTMIINFTGARSTSLASRKPTQDVISEQTQTLT